MINNVNLPTKYAARLKAYKTVFLQFPFTMNKVPCAKGKCSVKFVSSLVARWSLRRMNKHFQIPYDIHYFSHKNKIYSQFHCY